jgi:hypothetical protein
MPEMIVANARELDVSAAVPPTASHARLKISIVPAPGAVLVYTQGNADPVRFNGPEELKEVPLSGPKLYYQLVQGATDVQIAILGYTDPR